MRKDMQCIALLNRPLQQKPEASLQDDGAADLNHVSAFQRDWTWEKGNDHALWGVWEGISEGAVFPI